MISRRPTGRRRKHDLFKSEQRRGDLSRKGGSRGRFWERPKAQTRLRSIVFHVTPTFSWQETPVSTLRGGGGGHFELSKVDYVHCTLEHKSHFPIMGLRLWGRQIILSQLLGWALPPLPSRDTAEIYTNFRWCDYIISWKFRNVPP